MAKVDSITVNLSADTGAAAAVVAILSPLVGIGIVSPDRAVALAMRFVRIEVAEQRQR